MQEEVAVYTAPVADTAVGAHIAELVLPAVAVPVAAGVPQAAVLVLQAVAPPVRLLVLQVAVRDSSRKQGKTPPGFQAEPYNSGKCTLVCSSYL